VLDEKLQCMSTLPKWDPRSRLGVYLGHSPCHAGSVTLVLNPKTMYVSPQFHVVIDDKFSIVPYLSSTDIPPNWSELVSKLESVLQENYDLAKLWMQMQIPTDLLNQEGDMPQREIDLLQTQTKYLIQREIRISICY